MYKSFQTAYKLFDISILFIEKSLKILKKKSGILSFIITNKFLSSDYGIKLRELLIKNTTIKQIINISSLPIFSKKSAYPIIILIENNIPLKEHQIQLYKYDNLEKLIKKNHKRSIQF